MKIDAVIDMVEEKVVSVTFPVPKWFLDRHQKVSEARQATRFIAVSGRYMKEKEYKEIRRKSRL